MNDFYELFKLKTNIDLEKYDLTTKIEATYCGNPWLTKEMRITPIPMIIDEYGNKTETYFEIMNELEYIILNSKINHLQINKVVVHNNYACLSLITKEYNVWGDEEETQILYEFCKK